MYNINTKAFKLRESFFDNQSHLHGINHTYRVMYHVLNIGKAVGLNSEINLAFCAAFIHDMARKHDKYCTQHGAWSAKEKLPQFKDFFTQQGLKSDDLKAIKIAVSNHSINYEIRKEHPYYKTVALLKDADALDRIRISENNLKIKYLRYPQSVELVDFAKKLFYLTEDAQLDSFEQMVLLANKIQ